LWRAIDIYLSGAGIDAQLKLLTTWLSRSKSCALSLSFEVKYTLNPPQLPHFTEALLSHSERWEYVRLIIPFNDLRWIDGPLPLLCDLTFGPNHYPDRGSAVTATRLHDTPQLKAIVFGTRFESSRVALPWSQLTSITAEWLPIFCGKLLPL
jgi:hypothetical protein